MSPRVRRRPPKSSGGTRELVDLLCGVRERRQRCENDATAHLLLEDRQQGSQYMVLTCPGHRRNAVRGGRLVTSHRVSPGCGQPDSRWDEHENRCMPASGGDGW